MSAWRTRRERKSRCCTSGLCRGQLGADDFVEESAGGVRLTEDARKTVLTAYQAAKTVEVQHEFLDQTVAWARVPHLQALLLSRMLRGDLDAYPPFSVR